MKNLLIIWFVVLLFVSNSFAKLDFVSLDEAIKNSDLIVVGTLKDITENFGDGVNTGNGNLIIENVIAGNVKTENENLLKTGDQLQLHYIESFSCVMGSHKRIENEMGIFLLKLNDVGEIQYEDFRSLNNLPEINELLNKEIKPNDIVQTIRVINEDKQISQKTLNIKTSETVISLMESTESEVKSYSSFQAFLTILASISLYYLLYRSRFKIG